VSRVVSFKKKEKKLKKKNIIIPLPLLSLAIKNLIAYDQSMICHVQKI